MRFLVSKHMYVKCLCIECSVGGVLKSEHQCHVID